MEMFQTKDLKLGDVVVGIYSNDEPCFSPYPIVRFAQRWGSVVLGLWGRNYPFNL